MIIDMIMWFILLFLAHGIGIFFWIAILYVLSEDDDNNEQHGRSEMGWRKR